MNATAIRPSGREGVEESDRAGPFATADCLTLGGMKSQTRQKTEMNGGEGREGVVGEMQRGAS